LAGGCLGVPRGVSLETPRQPPRNPLQNPSKRRMDGGEKDRLFGSFVEWVIIKGMNCTK